MILATVVGVAGLLAFVGSTWMNELPLLWAKEGFRAKPLHVTMVVSIMVALVALIFLLASVLDTVKTEHAADIARKRAESLPPPIEAASPAFTPLQAAMKAYELRGFLVIGELRGLGAPQIWAKEAEPDDNQIFRRQGALVYPDGSATQFSIAVIYQDDIWKLGDEVNVLRGGAGRAVTIRTVINRPLIRELIQANDYVLGVGMASSAPSQQESRNQNLAHARAINIAVAIVHKLKLKDADHALGASLGYALHPPRNPAFEPRQRAVVLIGINASREVLVDQVITAAAQLVTVEGVNLSDYLHSGDAIVRSPSVADLSDYQKVGEVGETVLIDDRWTLPPME